MANRIDNGRQHRIDRVLARCDPIGGHVPASPGLAAAFDLVTASIVGQPRRVARRRARRPRTIVAFVAAVVLAGGGAAAAANLFIPARTRGPIMGHGIGAVINVDGTDYRQVAMQLSADIPYPKGYGSWRGAVIPWERQNQQPACGMPPIPGCMPKIPVAQLHGVFAASAFAAWVIDWRHDMMTGRQAAARRDARVISTALGWKAIRAEDPHPRLDVPGDNGSTHASAFGWMIPIIDAVDTGELARVNDAILQGGRYGGQLWLWIGVGMRMRQLPLYGQPLLSYLDRHGR
ncbi:MAG: hypothetical protein ACRDLV_12090 [Solirubrobacteraceae bacterium]